MATDVALAYETTAGMRDEELLHPAPSMKHVAFTFTNRCNLRCVYCPQGTHPDSFHADTVEEQLDKIIAYILSNDVRQVSIGYYGETMLIKGWEAHCDRFLGKGLYTTLVSSFSRIMTPAEVATAARFSELQVSIDTVDIQILKEVRKAVDARTILYNTHLIRAHVLAHGLPMPKIMWTGVLTDRVVFGMLDMVAMAISSGITHINFNDVAYFEGTSGAAKNVYDMADDDFIRAFETLEAARRLAVRHGVELSIGSAQRMEQRLIDEFGLERYTAITQRFCSFDHLPADRTVYVYGAGQAGRALREEMRSHPSLRFGGYIDSRRSGAVDNEIMMSLDAYKERRAEDDLILICSMYEDQIETALIDAGIHGYLRAYGYYKNGAARRGSTTQQRADIVRSGIQGKFVIAGDVLDDVPDGMTRLCESPWTEIYFDPKGEAYSCCQRGTVMGRLDKDVSIADIAGNESYRRLREQLLTGRNLDPECLRCTGRRVVSTEQMRGQVEKMMSGEGGGAGCAACATTEPRQN